MEAITVHDSFNLRGARKSIQEKSHLERIERKIGHMQAVRVGKTLYISGAVRWGSDGQMSADEAMKLRMRNAFEDVRQMLEVHGAGVGDIIKETVYTKNIEAAIGAEEIRADLYGGHTPTAKWVGVSRLSYPELLIEIGIVARIP